MASWKIGYPNNLDDATSYDGGIELYESFGVIPITMDSKIMCRAVAQVQGVIGTAITCHNITNYPGQTDATLASATVADAFEIGEFDRGYVRFLSGTLIASDKVQVYRVTNTTTSVLTIDTDVSADITIGDYIEVVSGACHYEFPVNRNPIRRDFKRVLKTEAMRFPYYERGLCIPIGYEADDYVISTYVTSQIEFDRLQVFLAHTMDYKGFDVMCSTGGTMDNDQGIAPVILETGSMDIMNQFIGVVNDFKFIKDAKRGDTFWELMIHMYNYHTVTYRGI